MGTSRINHLGWMTVSVLAVLASMLASSRSMAQERGSRPPPFAIVDSARPEDGALREYIRSLRFLSDHVSSDLRMVDPAHPAQIVRADPAVGNYLITEAELRVAGRITARLVNRGRDPVDRFALAPRGTTYLWIQYVGGTPKAVLISTDSTGAIVRRSPVRLTADTLDHPRFIKQSLARFGLDSTATMIATICGACPPWGWCKADSLHTAVW